MISSRLMGYFCSVTSKTLPEIPSPTWLEMVSLWLSPKPAVFALPFTLLVTSFSSFQTLCSSICAVRVLCIELKWWEWFWRALYKIPESKIFSSQGCLLSLLYWDRFGLLLSVHRTVFIPEICAQVMHSLLEVFPLNFLLPSSTEQCLIMEPSPPISWN